MIEKDLDGLSDLSLDAFLSLISEINDVTSIAARVDVSDLDGSVREKADKLSGHATVANRNMIVITCASPSLAFWGQIVRRRARPVYIHPELGG